MIPYIPNNADIVDDTHVSNFPPFRCLKDKTCWFATIPYLKQKRNRNYFTKLTRELFRDLVVHVAVKCGNTSFVGRYRNDEDWVCFMVSRKNKLIWICAIDNLIWYHHQWNCFATPTLILQLLIIVFIRTG